jgi:hypothetical protein
MRTNMYTSESRNYPVSFFLPFLILFFAFAALQTSAQEASADQNVSGTVTFSEDNEPAPGVNIYVKGSTALGTYSDANGKFKFPYKVKSGDILIFSFIGRKSAEYVVPSQTEGPIEIILGPDPITMVETVLVEGEPPHRPFAFARLFHKK